mgnify:CR=1 FL=1|tara:strand:+ start:975 stop:1616 length:642 start_codon:yes stop_codon:yes gene_type:complete
MNKKLIENKANFSLGLDIFFENNKKIRNTLFFIEYLSIFLTFCYFSLSLYFWFEIPILFITSILCILFIFVHSKNYSLYPNIRYINFLHFIFNPLIKLIIKNKLSLNTNYDYFDKIKNKKEAYFYNIYDIKPQEYNDALYYWYCIQNKTNSLEEKERALLNISIINTKIKEYNKRIKALDNNIANANQILKENNIDIDNPNKSKIKKITVLNI